MELTKNKDIVLFDGVCNLCNWSVQFIIKHDKKQHFVFTALQSDVANEILLHYPKNITKKDSILLIQNQQLFSESTAVLKIVRHFKGLWKLLLIFWIIPRPLRDVFYQFIAKYRYRWFGKKETCMLPSKENQNRFL